MSLRFFIVYSQAPGGEPDMGAVHSGAQDRLIRLVDLRLLDSDAAFVCVACLRLLRFGPGRLGVSS